LLLGLEILVISNLIGSITLDASYVPLVIVAFPIIIRIIVSCANCLQVEGRWP
jgi:hypothetical protein